MQAVKDVRQDPVFAVLGKDVVFPVFEIM